MKEELSFKDAVVARIHVDRVNTEKDMSKLQVL